MNHIDPQGLPTTIGVRGWLALLLALALAPACAVTPPPATGVPAPPPLASQPVMAEPSASIAATGSLWQPGAGMGELFASQKARRVGDILTIKVAESSSATNNAKTDTGRDSGLTASIDAFLGMEDRWNNPAHPKYEPFPKVNPYSKIGGTFESTFKGNGTTSRSGDLSAYLTARVVEVWPNGNLSIVGTREVKVNNERQHITLAGIVRPRDIDADNVILSTYVSDARIEYSGSGIVNDRQEPGWLVRVLDTVWPF